MKIKLIDPGFLVPSAR